MFPTKSPGAGCVHHPIHLFQVSCYTSFAKTSLIILICKFPILLKIIEQPMLGPTFCGKGSIGEGI